MVNIVEMLKTELPFLRVPSLRCLEVMPATPAFKYKLMAKDRLLAVNGVDVTGLPREQILPLFAARPLTLRMLRGGAVPPASPDPGLLRDNFQRPGKSRIHNEIQNAIHRSFSFGMT